MISLTGQIQEIERLFDALHDQCTEALGDNHPTTILALKGSCRTFAIYCDFLQIQGSMKDE